MRKYFILLLITSGFFHKKSSAQATGPWLMYNLIAGYDADKDMLSEKYVLHYGSGYIERMKKLYAEWQDSVQKLPFDRLPYEQKIDYLLLKRQIEKDENDIMNLAMEHAATRDLLSFDTIVSNFELTRRAGRSQNVPQLTASFQNLTAAVLRTNEGLNGLNGHNVSQYRFAEAALANMQNVFEQSFTFYNGYDPAFSQSVRQAFAQADTSLVVLRKSIVAKANSPALGADSSGINGTPIGYSGLVKGLRYEMIPYTPEEVEGIAMKEFSWCEKEMLKASAEMGFGDNWKAALEKTKTEYVPPGKQPELVKSLADEAIDFVEKKNLIKIPAGAKEGWYMRMLTPAEQKFAPFFLGGREILIAYPHESMDSAETRMALRGNNIHFSRAVVFHELIPGHNLQYYMGERYHPYRHRFGTSFWTEGWSLYWEMLLYDKGFAGTPEDKVGMLFWRMHRCARIIFSINYHTGKWTPARCIDFLVDKVGHERANAEAEVRRSFAGNYGPLYQIGYMLGGLQFRALYKELVASGKMDAKTFHERILREGNMPVELTRAILTKQPLTKNFSPKWRFAAEAIP